MATRNATLNFKQLREYYMQMSWDERIIEGLTFYSDLEDIMFLNSDRVCEEWRNTMTEMCEKFNEGDAVAITPTVLALVHIAYYQPWILDDYYVVDGVVKRHYTINYRYIWPSDKKSI